jgi:hypothetical protein
MDYGTAIGAKSSTASANVGQALGQGMINSAQAMNASNQYSPWASLLGTAGQQMQNYQQSSVDGTYRFNPFTGQPL